MNKEIEDKVDRIIREYGREDHPSPEDAEFVQWLLDERHKAEKDKALWKAWNGFAGMKHSAKTYASLRKIKAQLGLPAPKRRISTLGTASIAASLLILITVGSLWLARDSGKTIVADIPVKTPVETPIAADNTRKWTAAESVVQEILPDSSQVRLQPNSSLTYSEATDGTIYADLSGEGFFDIQRKDSAAFVVRTSTLQVRVHGTQFNVKDYPGENYTTVTLYQGKVEVIFPDKSYFMKPGHLLSYVHDSGEVLYDALPSKNAAQNDDMLNFEQLELVDILQMISNIYGVEIEVAEGDYLSDPLSISFNGKESIEELMLILQQLSGEFSYDIEDGTIKIHSN